MLSGKGMAGEITLGPLLRRTDLGESRADGLTEKQVFRLLYILEQDLHVSRPIS